MIDVRALVSQCRSGVHWVGAETDSAAIARTASRFGWDFALLDGDEVIDKGSLLDAAAKGLSFPATFGRNWDALEDCLCDLSWRTGKGTLLLWAPVDPIRSQDPGALETAIDVLRASASWWAREGRPFLALLGGMRRPRGLGEDLGPGRSRRLSR
ncbi:MAG TPA: barstar family protein [Anaeromyxobacteraceae bacterium]|nr:barstar family protein [Anaeromyxobacteraceae bacterium]